MKTAEPWINVAKPAWNFFVPLSVVTVIAAIAAILTKWTAAWIVCAVLAILAAYVLYFFRDPRRAIPGVPNALVSPADGVVVSVIELPCERMPGGRARRIAIFLNVFNVHIQRASAAGRVLAIERRAGRFMNAMNEKCSEENEQVTMWLETSRATIGIRQIAGAIARRIVCHAMEGDDLAAGERYGLIQFGSRVELFLPTDVEVKTAPGQKVKGGETVLALFASRDGKAESSR